jgi:hypothetical protein
MGLSKPKVLANELKSLTANLKIELVQKGPGGSISWPLCGNATASACFNRA